MSSRDIDVSFLSWNIYQGTDTTPLTNATPEQIPERVTEIFRLFLATNHPITQGYQQCWVWK